MPGGPYMAIRMTEEEYLAIAKGKSLSSSDLSKAKGRRNKYHNKKTVLDGHEFDSEYESEKYAELLLLEKSGEITDLKLQPVFVLIPTIRDGSGKVIQRAVTYKADFSYLDLRTGRVEVLDAKGVKTDVYKLKKKMMLYFHGIEITEI